MIQITAQMRVLVGVEPVDGRKGIDSLARLCQENPQPPNSLLTPPLKLCTVLIKHTFAAAMFFRLNQSSGVPLYLQLMDQVRHAIDTGALKPGDQLPGIRKLAEDLVMNPNTVVRAYRELEHEGVLELRHGSGAFIAESVVARSRLMNKAQAIVQAAVEKLQALGLTGDEIRRLWETVLAMTNKDKLTGERK
jgi:GntR family transcriptional regulator